VSITVPFLPIVLVPFIFLVAGVILFVAAIGVYLRDLMHITNFIIMAIFRQIACVRARLPSNKRCQKKANQRQKYRGLGLPEPGCP
jgi:hypothetical protein